MNKIIIATGNLHKLDEYRKLLYNYKVITPLEEGIIYKGVEEGDDYKTNAEKKVDAVLQQKKNIWILGEDSGLEVDALKGKPGTRSARFVGSDKENREKILELMTQIPWFKRTARFRCVIVLWDGREKHIFEDTCEGLIGVEEKGEKGFGYDPIFIPWGFSKTFAELGERIKNKISHRAKAVKKLKEFLESRGVAQPG